VVVARGSPARGCTAALLRTSSFGAPWEHAATAVATAPIVRCDPKEYRYRGNMAYLAVGGSVRDVLGKGSFSARYYAEEEPPRARWEPRRYHRGSASTRRLPVTTP
jgi:hypothetical protein